jgi:hypothetical protein
VSPIGRPWQESLQAGRTWDIVDAIPRHDRDLFSQGSDLQSHKILQFPEAAPPDQDRRRERDPNSLLVFVTRID